jgi:hypothetical protein
VTTTNPIRHAAVSAWLAIPALVLSVVFVAMFFSGAGGLYGSLNDLFVAVTAVLLILPARSLVDNTRSTGGRWFDVVTWTAIAGMALIAAGQILLIARLISLSASFVTGGVGIMPVLVWALVQCYLGLRYGVPSRPLGWSMLTVLLVAGLVSAVSAAGWQTATWILTAVLLAAISAYLAVLGRHLK